MNQISVEPTQEVVKSNGHGNAPIEMLVAPGASSKKRRLFAIGGGVVLAALLASVPAIHSALIHESTDDAFIDAHIITISPKVDGQVVAVHVTDNQLVKAG